MAKQKPFDLQEQLRKALDWLLGNRWERLDGSRWISATDLERRVRAAAVEIAQGYEYGYCGSNGYMSSPRIQGLGSRSLLDHCRSFLMGRVRAGELDANNPRGHTITGMRFRPKGEELSESEKRTLAVPREERNKHVSHLKHTEQKEYTDGNGVLRFYTVDKPECQKTRKKARFSSRIKSVWYNNEKPSCKKCQAIMAKRAGLVKDTPIEMVRDRLEELGLIQSK